jgi:hypothetical protein
MTLEHFSQRKVIFNGHCSQHVTVPFLKFIQLLYIFIQEYFGSR